MGKLQEITAENNVSNGCQDPRQEGTKGGDSVGSPDYHPCKRDMGKRTVLENQRHKGEVVRSA